MPGNAGDYLIEQNPKLKKAWDERWKKKLECQEKLDELNALLVEGNRTHVSRQKLSVEAYLFAVQADYNWILAVEEVHGDIKVSMSDDGLYCKLGNGEEYRIG